ncbi:PAS domain-containing protein, partial [Streptomyces sp. NPDC006386]|uniref:PAS domain-containing protein n=1 Tax=Streptomyces sp. NPDC006386 TaxID=3156762 RepID=UPI0033B18425
MEDASAAAIIDARGTVTGWSEGARQLTGYPAEEAVGRPVRELLAEDVPPEAVSARSGTVMVRHRDGYLVGVRVRACAVTGRHGEPDGFVITAAPPGPGETSLAGRAFQQASMSMSVFDTGQRYLRLNEAACHVMGVSEETLLGRHFPETVEEAEHSRGFNWHLRHVVETGRPLRYESYTGAPALNREHAWVTEMWPVRDSSGELVGTALAAFDSTEQYWARQRLALLNEGAAAIGTTLDVVRTAEELTEVMVPRFADFASVDLFDWVLGADEAPAARRP